MLPFALRFLRPTLTCYSCAQTGRLCETPCRARLFESLDLDLNPPTSDKVYRFPLPLLALLSQSIFRSPCFRREQSKTSFRRMIEAKKSIFCLCSKGPELADWARSHPAPNRVRPALRF